MVTKNPPRKAGSHPGMGSFGCRVTTASGATAVQIVHKHGREVVGIEHIGSGMMMPGWRC